MKVFLRFGNMLVLALIILLAIISFYHTGLFGKIFNKSYVSLITKSDIDYDNDDIDDYSDILEGAKKFIDKKPRYKSAYYDGGYPTDDNYVCTDIIWFALKNAGYDFKKLIDEDISNNKKEYDEDVGDKNIDFRRVRNINVFLERNTMSLSVSSIDTFNPGDIVVYKDHIAIVSDRKNSKGINYILHHDGYHDYEDDGLFRKDIIGHYRWRLKDGSK